MAKKKIIIDEALSGSLEEGIALFDQKIEADILYNRRKDITPIPLSRILPNEKNSYSLENIDELANSIAVHGLLEPILVIPDGENYRLVSGERRYLAAKQAGYDPIEAIVLSTVELESTDEEILLIVANSYRTKTSSEKAQEIARLTELYRQKEEEAPGFLQGLNVTQMVANKMDVSPLTVTRALRLEKLIPEMQALVDEEQLSASAAEKYAKFSPQVQQDVAQYIREKTKRGETFTREEAAKLQKQLRAEEKEKAQVMTALKKEQKDLTVQLKGYESELKKAEKKGKPTEELSRLVSECKTHLEENKRQWEQLESHSSLLKSGDQLETLFFFLSMEEQLRQSQEKIEAFSEKHYGDVLDKEAKEKYEELLRSAEELVKEIKILAKES